MIQRDDDIIVIRETSGTSIRTFHATDVAEQWGSPETEESEEISIADDSQKVLKKISRRVKK